MIRANMRKPYVPDLIAHATLCEGNYLRLLKLLPELEQGIGREYHLHGGSHHKTQICLTITENFKYTQTIEVVQTSALNDFLNPPTMVVRLYHDVRMAEVVSFDNQHRFNGVYHYPNPQMRMPDEKIQINQFLHQWLEHCFEHAQANIALIYHPSWQKCDSSTGSD